MVAAKPTTVSVASGSLCIRSAMLSSFALQTLSTRPEFSANGQVSSIVTRAGGGGGGGATTLTEAVHVALRLRSSVTRAVAVMAPGPAPVVSSRTAAPVPTILPLLAVHW